MDWTERIVTIGKSVGAILGLDAKDARNLDQVQVRDKVELEFIRSVSLAVIQGGSRP